MDFRLCSGLFVTAVALAICTPTEAACNEKAMNECADSHFKDNYAVLEDVMSKSLENRFIKNYTYTDIKSACRIIKSRRDCVEKSGCEQVEFGLSQGRDGWPSTVDMNCKEAVYCQHGILTAEANHMGVAGAALVGSYSVSDCPGALAVSSILHKDVPQMCNMIPSVKYVLDRWKGFENFCLEKQCMALQTCRGQYDQSGPAASGMDVKTCKAYGDYVECAVYGIASNCTDIKSPIGEPTTDLKDIHNQACSLTDPQEIERFFQCQEFSSCIDGMENSYDISSPQNFCRKTQDMLGCAINNFEVCSAGLASQFVDKFLQDAIELSLTTAARGCGVPNFNLTDCPQFNDCKRTWVEAMGDTTDVATQAMKMYDMQNCLNEAKKNCSLHRSSEKLPVMYEISVFTKGVYDVIYGGRIGGCEILPACYNGLARMAYTLSDGAYLATRLWCRSTVTATQCIWYFIEECKFVDYQYYSLKYQYEQLMNIGCPDLYGWKSTSQWPAAIPTAPPVVTTAPTGTGAPTNPSTGFHLLMAVSLVLLSLVLKTPALL